MGKMIKNKLEGYQFENHINGYNDYIMDGIHSDYTDTQIKIRSIKNEFEETLQMLYSNYVRKDPFRPLYNY